MYSTEFSPFYLFRYTETEWEDIPANCHMSSKEHLNEYIERCTHSCSVPYYSHFEEYDTLQDALKRFDRFKESHPTITNSTAQRPNTRGEWCAYCVLEYYKDEFVEIIKEYAQAIDWD